MSQNVSGTGVHHNGSVADFRIRWAIVNWGGGGGEGVGAEPQQEPQPVALELC